MLLQITLLLLAALMDQTSQGLGLGSGGCLQAEGLSVDQLKAHLTEFKMLADFHYHYH